MLRDLLRRILPQPSTRRFDAAGGGRRWSAAPSFGPINPEVLAAAEPVRRRALYFARNNPHAIAGVSALVSHLTGYGIKPTSKHPDAAVRAALQTAWDRWTVQADADGASDHYGQQALLTQTMIECGEAFARLIPTRSGLRVQALPAEMIDLADTRELGGGARVVGGIEFDSNGRRVAYHVFTSDPTAAFETRTNTVRIPAADMVHLYRPLSPGQVRGISWLAPVLSLLHEHDQFSDAALMAAKIQAMHAGFLVDQNGTGGAAFEGTQAGSVMETGLEPGTLRYLPSGWDIKFSNPAQMAEGAAFAASQLRAVAAGLGIPEHLLTGDLSNANYSSLRAGMVAFRQRIEPIQHGIIVHQLVRPVWRRFVATLILSGQIAAPDFETNPEAWLDAEFYPPPMAWIDPAKDAEATATMIAAGLKSRRQAIAELGYDAEALDAEIAADRQREARLGLRFTANTGEQNAG
ncbi:phage portal protein [Roseomonas sp. M0104]|uniref:Phage portal protein n=1 Tax=Teichococcus coralli TaxID=2545983 RepID=A0A845B8C5_9PROT|nr:phage portal protein [Pseudoroseomonas coralli]MXP62778.1 phage portal protein [Pseudoroseomonas coralli]